MNVLVLGGCGFIGRHAVQALRNAGVSPTIGTRRPDHPSHIEIQFELKTRAKDWHALVGQYDVILNCVGILRPQRRASYDQVQHLVPAAIAQACVGRAVRFIHVSALGLAASDRSGFLISKSLGERAIQSTTCDWVLVRPSLLDGEHGFGAAWLRGVSKLPLFVYPKDATGRIAALTAQDLGEALAALCLRESSELGLAESRIFELGGEDQYNFPQYIRGLRSRYSDRRALAIPIPGWSARLAAHVCDLLHFTPFSFGHWELLRKDNVPNPNRLAELLGRPPTKVISNDPVL